MGMPSKLSTSEFERRISHRNQKMIGSYNGLGKPVEMECHCPIDSGRWSSYASSVLRSKNSACPTCFKREVADRTIVHSHDKTFFSHYGEVSSYWAGFIAADGSIRKDNTLAVVLKYSDSNHLEQFKQDIAYTGSIKRYSQRTNFGIVETTSLRISSAAEIIKSLSENYNVIARKTRVLVPPESLDLQNSVSFIKGLIDGDGSIGENGAMSFAGTYAVCEWVSGILDTICPSNRGGVKPYQMKGRDLYGISVSPKRGRALVDLMNRIAPSRGMARKWGRLGKYTQGD